MDLRELLAAMLSESQLSPPAPAGAADRLAELLLLLHQWGRQLNLTGHGDPKTAARGLVGDAIGLAEVLPSDCETLADIGSGAGFPGLPLAILRPKLRVRSVEARERRLHFQREAIRVLGLSTVEPLLGRAEALPVEPADVAVAQAVADPPSALALLSPWTREGGLAVLPVGTELAETAHHPGFQAPVRRSYRRYQEKSNRIIYLWKKSPTREGC